MQQNYSSMRFYPNLPSTSLSVPMEQKFEVWYFLLPPSLQRKKMQKKWSAVISYPLPRSWPRRHVKIWLFASLLFEWLGKTKLPGNTVREHIHKGESPKKHSFYQQHQATADTVKCSWCASRWRSHCSCHHYAPRNLENLTISAFSGALTPDCSSQVPNISSCFFQF